MTNKEAAQSLRALATVYESLEEETPLPSLTCFAYTKDQVVRLIKAIGGRFEKDMGDENDEHASIKYKSLKIPGFTIWIYRSKVCKLVRREIEWDCEPLLSPEDEAEIEGVR